MNVSGKTSRSTSSLFARSIQATALLAVDKASMNTGETWAAATFILKNRYFNLFSIHLKSSAASTTCNKTTSKAGCRDLYSTTSL